jgi:hypothetical protein
MPRVGRPRDLTQANQPRLFGLDAELVVGRIRRQTYASLAGPTLHPYTRGLVILARSPSRMGVARPTPTPQRAATTAQRASRPSLCMTDSLRAAATHPLVANLARQEIALASVWAVLRILKRLRTPHSHPTTLIGLFHSRALPDSYIPQDELLRSAGPNENPAYDPLSRSLLRLARRTGSVALSRFPRRQPSHQ